MTSEHVMETDVLIIGGGMAGCFAAVKAKEQGAEVMMVDKGYVGKSGQTPFAHFFSVFNAEWGHNLDDLVNYISKTGDYVNNREWTEIIPKESYARFQDLLSWGVEFSKTADGEFRRLGSEPNSELYHFSDFAPILRKQVVKSGVKIIDRIMVTNLLKQDGQVVGAVGIPMDSSDFYVFKAKATIISAGASGFKPTGWPISELTADGQAMAYRAGAEITGKEFPDTHWTFLENPALGIRDLPIPEDAPKDFRLFPPRFRNAEGDEISTVAEWSLHLHLEFEAHAGRAPTYLDLGLNDTSGKLPGVVGGPSAGMSIHNAEGIWPINAHGASSLPGLYAAGDSCATMQLGPVYSALGHAICGAAVTGARAGLAAAGHASQAEKPILDKEKLTQLKEALYTPRNRKGGFSPAWVTQVLQNTMIPYFISYIKHGDRIQAALTIVEFLRDQLVPKLMAKDAHELRLAHETKNMILSAEMILKASLFRTESRGTHYREDYPTRDDPTWLAWVKLKEEQGEMKMFREPIPKEWWPDLSTPHSKRYPYRYPGE